MGKDEPKSCKAGRVTEQDAGAKGERKKGAARDQSSQVGCGCRFPLLVAVLQLLLGVTITVVAFIMRSISSSLLARDTPYWVGIVICLAGLLGLYMFCITYEVDEKTTRQFVVKLIYFLLGTLGLILSVSAVAFAGHHYNQITKFTCQMNSNHCMCSQDPEDQIARTFRYNDVQDCDSVTSTIKLYLLLQMVLNISVVLVCLLGCYLMWKHRYQVFFAGLHFHSFKTKSEQQQKV
ncbi:sarcospan isoform X1 [Narcine bancroftii]|uniref:sarcospan isoform X1 n=2 Tax=Narcine bancroftii TaxID=1343680 RepID=UPI0038311577